MSFKETPITLILFILIAGTSLLALFKAGDLKSLLALNPFSVFHRKKYYQVLTNIFVHYDFTHLIFNLLTFYFFSPQLETTIGSFAFAVLFLTAGVVSSIPSLIKYRNNPLFFSLGASGAISGVVFSFIFLYPMSRIYFFFIPFGIPAPIFALLYLIYCIYASKRETTINHEAHFWGAVWGLVFTILIHPESVSIFLWWMGKIF
jgi:membrane associated rhomboid family serine protease